MPAMGAFGLDLFYLCATKHAEFCLGRKIFTALRAGVFPNNLVTALGAKTYIGIDLGLAFGATYGWRFTWCR